MFPAERPFAPPAASRVSMSDVLQGGSRPEAAEGSERGALLVVLGILATLVAVAGCAGPGDEDASQVTLVFDFGGLRDEAPQRVEREITYDPDRRPTMQLYEETGAPRPDAYTVHDLLVHAEERTELAIEITRDEPLGYLLATVEGRPGEGTSAYWALSVDGEPARASLGALTVDPGARYEWHVEEIEPGNRPGQARAEAGGPGDEAEEQARFVVDYNGFRNETPQRTEHRVPYDPDSRPTMPLYEGTDTQRPDAYILHDLVSDWANRTGTPYEVREDEDLGFRLVSVDDVRARSDDGGSWAWRLAIDGDPETASLNAIEVEDGRTYRWTFERVEGDG